MGRVETTVICPPVPTVIEPRPGSTTPVPSSSAAWSPAPATTGISGRRPRSKAGVGRSSPTTVVEARGVGSAWKGTPQALASVSDQRRWRMS